MKNKLMNISRAAALAVCAFAATEAQAGSMPDILMNVPFDFVVSGKTLPAGEYRVFRANTMSATPAFVVRNMRTKSAAIAVMMQRTPGGSDKAEATFVCSENKCYFRDMKVNGMESYFAAVPRKSSAQKEKMTSVALRPSVNAD
ncbi:MAG TPA: hypothetical protein VFB63_28450 [Bryobacteraceae bacterium]|nr:hypothetical protein [Bryobacteraceae bacterium]